MKNSRDSKIGKNKENCLNDNFKGIIKFYKEEKGNG